MRVLFILAVEPLLMRLAYGGARFERRIRDFVRSFRLNQEIRRWKTLRAEILDVSEPRPGTRVGDLGLDPETLCRIEARLEQGEEVVIAQIDQDGFYRSHFGPIGRLPTVDDDRFLPRWKFQLRLVARNKWVGVKKSYRGNKRRFLNELYALHALGSAGCRVPAILDVDFDRLSITTALIPGDVLRERLARQHALLRDRDVARDPALGRLSAAEQRRKRIENGARVVNRVVDDHFIDELLRQLRIVHGAKIAWNDFKYGNIIIERETGLPWLIDFDAADDCRGMSRYVYRVLCDADIESFNRHFNRACWTHQRIRRYVRSPKENPLARKFYAPAYVGCGIRFGPIWRIGTGFGRWDYILRDNLPDVRGKRVLVLGANNGFNAIQLLRSGAREVVAVEVDEAVIRQGEILRELYEWSDSRPLNLRFIEADMATVPEMELGRFDLALALCSLYYLDVEDMCRVTRHLSRVAPVFVLQANNAIGLRRRCLETYAKSRIEFLEELLRTNGFESTHIISYRGYPRPLVVGRRCPSEAAIAGPHTAAKPAIPVTG